MRVAPFFAVASLSLAALACNDSPLKSGLPEVPPPATHATQAFVQVDNAAAQPGDQIHVFVRVQLGTDNSAKLGSYTGRLTFDPTVLAYKGEVKINDGLRVTNPNGAGQGQLRFAGAAAGGFADLTLYEAVFEVKKPDYVDALKLSMEELSAAGTLADLRKTLQQPPQVFLSKSGQ
jgi:Cohesin domain